MKFGLALPQYAYSLPEGNVDFAQVRDIAQMAEELGYWSVWVSDHLFLDLAKYGGDDRRYDALECFTTLGGLAEATSSIRLGSLVVCNDLRHPSLVAKMAATIQLTSKGRMTLGMGAGWYEPEFSAIGARFPSPAERVARLGEAVQIVKGMLASDHYSFDGRYYKIAEAVNMPRGEQPPILIGGKGNKVLQIAAQHADVYNTVWTWTPEAYAERLGVLRSHEADAGRPGQVAATVGLYTLIGQDRAQVDQLWERYRTVSPAGTGPTGDVDRWGADKLVGTPDQIEARLARFEAMGVEEVILGFGSIPFQLADLESVERFARIFITDERGVAR